MEPSQNPVQVSPSRLNTFFTCPKKYHYTYVQELINATKERSNKFDKGNYFHELAHIYYQNIKAGATPGSFYLQETIKNRILQDLANMPSPSSELLRVYDNISKRMLRYITEQSPKIDQGIEVTEVEAELNFDTGKGYTLFGYADVIFNQQGHLVVRDHKTGEKMWSKLDVQFHNQNFYYAVILFMTQGLAAKAEINFICTKDYVHKEPPVLYGLASHLYSKRELEIYYEQICKVIEQMLQSEPIPFYGKHCSYCPYQTPCFMERKGMDSSELIKLNFTKREARHGRFTEENAVDTPTHKESSSLPIKW